MKNSMKIAGLLLIAISLSMGAVSAHGVDVTPESTIVITDNSTAHLAKQVVDETGVNATVYKFKSDADVTHQLEHALSNPNKKILAVAYQGTVNEFLSRHPDLSNRVIVCSANETSIKQGLNKLTTTSTSTGFVTPFLSGLIIGLVAGLGSGAFLMKRKLS
jgi:hypothetical protein